MIGAELAKQFTRNTRFLAGQLEGITHAQSLAQPDFGANCLNWTVGHILRYRRDVALLAGIEPAPFQGYDRYARESDPITEDGPGVVDFSELVKRLLGTEPPLDDALTALSSDELARTIESGDRVSTRLSRILFLYFHDTLHVGQADVLAELSRRS